MDPKKKYHCPICNKNCRLNNIAFPIIKGELRFINGKMLQHCYVEQIELHCNECDITWTENNDI